MPVYKIHLRRRSTILPEDIGIAFPSLDDAYLEICRIIPDTARDLLIEGRDPLAASYIICDAKGRQLMEVPFDDVLSPREWRLRHARRRPYGGARSERARDDLALSSFRRIFDSVNVGCVLMTPELQVREMNAFGARHSHVDPEAIRDTSILDIFDLTGAPKADFTRFMLLAQAGAVSEVIDLPYLVLDEAGQTANGWWNARIWPIFDDDDRLLGLVEWAEPFTRPTAQAGTLVRIAPGSST